MVSYLYGVKIKKNLSDGISTNSSNCHPESCKILWNLSQNRIKSLEEKEVNLTKSYMESYADFNKSL